tara:strand:+ start:964 stop:1950 length:987 start_codon:yes stop_codon:yes gene_type:complete
LTVPKDVKKVTAKVGDAVLTTKAGIITFPKKYTAWKRQCSSLGPEKVGGKTSLLVALRRHGVPTRPTSPNAGGVKGMKFTLMEIEKVIKSRPNGIYYDSDVETFQELLDDLDIYGDGGDLDPASIPFTTYPMSRGKRIPDAKPKKIHGHYIDEYFASKYTTSVKVEEAKGWSSKEKGSANPPLKQAIFGGPLFTESLNDILQLAIKEIENMEYNIEIKTGRSPVRLVNIPSFSSKLAGAIKSSLIDDAISVNGVRGKMNGIFFPIETEKEESFVADYAKAKGIGGTFTSFKVNMTPAATKKLIETYMGTSRGRKERDIVKSWVELLRF